MHSQTEWPGSTHDALDYLSIFLHDDSIDVTVHVTNRYTQQDTDATHLKPRFLHSALETNNSLGNKINSIFWDSYFDGFDKELSFTSHKLRYYDSGFLHFMTVNPFSLILKFLHFVDNDSQPTDNE